MQITLDRAILEKLREHASSAAHFAGHIEGAIAVGPLADHVDEIVHTLSELLDKPQVIAAPVPSACATSTPAVDVPEHVSPERALANHPRRHRRLGARHERGGVVNHRDVAEAANEVRRVAAEADALASGTKDQFDRIAGLTDPDDRRSFERVAHMVGLTARAALAAAEASEKLFAIVDGTLPEKSSGMES
jgi:hypothetical protein